MAAYFSQLYVKTDKRILVVVAVGAVVVVVVAMLILSTYLMVLSTYLMVLSTYLMVQITYLMVFTDAVQWQRELMKKCATAPSQESLHLALSKQSILYYKRQNVQYVLCFSFQI